MANTDTVSDNFITALHRAGYLILLQMEVYVNFTDNHICLFSIYVLTVAEAINVN